MLLADTSVWIHHFRYGDVELAKALSEGLVYMHPFVSGELACGNLKGRADVMADLGDLPEAVVASSAEVLELIERRKLWGRGLGWIDMHLLASALLTPCVLWTLDKGLGETARGLGIALQRLKGKPTDV
jgi:predicted nucleic acid-binding protein